MKFFYNLSFSKKFLSEVYKLLRISLTIPVTTATAERSFSFLRRLKTFIHSTIGQPRLNHVLLLHVHKERTDTIDILKIATEFTSTNERRKIDFVLLYSSYHLPLQYVYNNVFVLCNTFFNFFIMIYYVPPKTCNVPLSMM